MNLFRILRMYSFALAFVICSNQAKSQNENHPSIVALQISYQTVSQPTLAVIPASPVGIYSIAKVVIKLKDSINASKIYFKVIDPDNNGIVYQVSYLISAPLLTNALGTVLFQNNNGVIEISSGQVTALKAYNYEISTEDDQQILSPIFFDRQ